jgi:hypothetical protein
LIIENIQIIFFADRVNMGTIGERRKEKRRKGKTKTHQSITVCKTNNLNILNNQIFFFADRVNMVVTMTTVTEQRQNKICDVNCLT